MLLKTGHKLARGLEIQVVLGFLLKNINISLISLKNSNYIWKKYHIEQVYISKVINEQYFWPKSWCQSFKHNLLPKWPLRYGGPQE